MKQPFGNLLRNLIDESKLPYKQENIENFSYLKKYIHMTRPNPVLSVGVYIENFQETNKLRDSYLRS